MPRIRYESVLGTLGEGLESGLDAAGKMQQLTQREEVMDKESRETKAAQSFMKGLKGLTPEQQEAAGGMGQEALPYAIRAAENQQAQMILQQEAQALQYEVADALSDDQYPVDEMRAKQILTQYQNDPTKGREALFELKLEARHTTSQKLQRTYARERAEQIRAENSALFAAPAAGLDLTFEQEAMRDAYEDTMVPPTPYGKPPSDYIGALAEMEILANPKLAPAYGRILARAQRDFESWAQLAGQEDTNPPATTGPAGLQENLKPRARQAANAAPEAPGATGLGPQLTADGSEPSRKPGATAKEGGRPLPQQAQDILAEESKPEEKKPKRKRLPFGQGVGDPLRRSIFNYADVTESAAQPAAPPPDTQKPAAKKPKAESKFEEPPKAGEVIYEGKRYKVVGRATPGAEKISISGRMIFVIPADQAED